MTTDDHAGFGLQPANLSVMVGRVAAEPGVAASTGSINEAITAIIATTDVLRFPFLIYFSLLEPNYGQHDSKSNLLL